MRFDQANLFHPMRKSGWLHQVADQGWPTEFQRIDQGFIPRFQFSGSARAAGLYQASGKVSPDTRDCF
jgi:hypothetical protein